MKILYITTIGGMMDFFKGFIKELLADGHAVDIAANEAASRVPDCCRQSAVVNAHGHLEYKLFPCI